MKKLVNLINFNIKIEDSHCSVMKERFSEDEGVICQQIPFYKEVNRLLQEQLNGVLLFKIEKKEEFLQVLAILKANYELIERGFLIPACLLGVKSQKVEKLLFKYGCRDIVDINVNPKTLVLKTELWVRTLSNLLNTDEGTLTLGQRAQEIDSHDEINLTEQLPERDLVGNEEQLEEEVNELLGEMNIEEGIIQEDNADLELEKEQKLNFVTTEESSPELVTYIKESGEVGSLNLETGYLGILLKEGEHEFNCIFENFEEEFMTLEVAENYGAQVGNELSVWVKFIYNKCRVEIELSGKISEIESIENGLQHVTVAFSKAEIERYDYFMALYQQRQKSINDFMELAKGY